MGEIASYSETAGRRFKPYPSYKDSGVDWLAMIPEHWEVKRLKYLSTVNDEALSEKTDPGFELIYIDIGGVDQFQGVVQREQLVFEDAPSRARRIVKDGDVILSTVRTYLRAIAAIINPEPNLICSTGFAVVRPSAELKSEFAAYALRAAYFVDRVVANSVGVSYPAIDASKLTSFPIAIPDVEEQRAIAAFLDRETSKIDVLIAKKERLIALLQEKRTALITHAVTKGLDPNISMKDSGIEWLGQIPAHWSARPLSQTLFRITYGFTNPMPAAQDGPYMITALDIGDGEILYETARHTTDEAFADSLTDKSRPQAGDILLTKDGTLGRVALANGTRICINQSVALLRFDPILINVSFILNLFRSALYQDRVIFEAGGTTIKHIYISRLAKMPVALPSLNEQCSISAFIEIERAKTDTLLEKIQTAIECLKELRTALISAAVTGKIDVRGEL